MNLQQVVNPATLSAAGRNPVNKILFLSNSGWIMDCSPKQVMGDYDPKSLPDVDAIEVVDIRHLDANRVWQYMQIAGNEPCVRIKGNAAQPFAEAWRSLAPGESARCHLPPIGLRFICNGRILLEASVCWRCNNLFGLSEGLEIHYAFDSSSTASKTLFALAQESVGTAILGDG